MKKEIYEQQKAFAGEKIPSMSRRKVGHDYQQRQIYMITMATEGRLPLLGKVVGKSDGQKGTPEEPRVELTELGKQVERNWHDIAVRYPQIDVLALQMMPDHFHGILFVKEHIEKPLGKVLLGFKQGCNKAYRRLFPSASPPLSRMLLYYSNKLNKWPDKRKTANTASFSSAVTTTNCWCMPANCSGGMTILQTTPAAC